MWRVGIIFRAPLTARKIESATNYVTPLHRVVHDNDDNDAMGTCSCRCVQDWVKWDSGTSVSTYASRMAVSGWGGGIEMAACSHLKRVNVHVYERSTFGTYKRISCFDYDGRGTPKTIHVLYCGGVHYDALVP